MGLFGTFSSSSEDSSTSKDAAVTAQPTRSARRACWDSRDAYYACLTSQNITIPPGTDMSDGKGPVGKLAAEEQRKWEEKGKKLQDDYTNDPCKEIRRDYEENCAKSWIDYFNKRRVLEERQRLMYSQGQTKPLGR